MEHRWSLRKLMTASVIVECPRIGMVRACMRDISLGGMFIETGPISLPLNAPIAVSFNSSTFDDQRDDHRLQAMVVRQAPNGVGLMFLESEVDVIRSLREVLYGPPVPRQQPRAAVNE
jgi:hypothetical protein